MALNKVRTFWSQVDVLTSGSLQYEVREDECSASGIEENKPSQGNIIQDALKLRGIDISSTDYDIVGNEQVEGDALHTIILVVLENLKKVAMDILPPVGCSATYVHSL